MALSDVPAEFRVPGDFISVGARSRPSRPSRPSPRGGASLAGKLAPLSSSINSRSQPSHLCLSSRSTLPLPPPRPQVCPLHSLIQGSCVPTLSPHSAPPPPHTPSLPSPSPIAESGDSDTWSQDLLGGTQHARWRQSCPSPTQHPDNTTSALTPPFGCRVAKSQRPQPQVLVRMRHLGVWLFPLQFRGRLSSGPTATPGTPREKRGRMFTGRGCPGQPCL